MVRSGSRAQRVAVFNFGTDGVRVLENKLGSGIENFELVFFGYIPKMAFSVGTIWLNKFWDAVLVEK